MSDECTSELGVHVDSKSGPRVCTHPLSPAPHTPGWDTCPTCNADFPTGDQPMTDTPIDPLTRVTTLEAERDQHAATIQRVRAWAEEELRYSDRTELLWTIDHPAPQQPTA